MADDEIGIARRGQRRSFSDAGTPLLFAWNTIVISIHPDVRAIVQEEGGLSARSHL
jgi:hypothetical protein